MVVMLFLYRFLDPN